MSKNAVLSVVCSLLLTAALAILMAPRAGLAAGPPLQPGDKVEASVWGQWVPCKISGVTPGSGGTVAAYKVACTGLDDRVMEYSESETQVRADTGAAAARLKKIVDDAFHAGDKVEAQVYGEWQACTIAAVRFSSYAVDGYRVQCKDLTGHTVESSPSAQQVRADTGEAAARIKKMIQNAFHAGDKVEAQVYGEWETCTVASVNFNQFAIGGYGVQCKDLADHTLALNLSQQQVRADTGEAAARIAKIRHGALHPGDKVEAQIYGEWQPCTIGAVNFNGFSLGGYSVRCADLAGGELEHLVSAQQVRTDTGEAAARNKKLLDASFHVGDRVESEIWGMQEPCTVAEVRISGYTIASYALECKDLAGKVRQWIMAPGKVRADTGAATARNKKLLDAAFHVGDVVEVRVSDEWQECVVRSLAIDGYTLNGYQAECTSDLGEKSPVTTSLKDIRAATGEAASRREAALKWEEEAGRNVALKYGGARPPAKCDSRSAPEEGPISEGQVITYLSCAMEGENDDHTQLALVGNVKVEIGKLRQGDRPTYAIRGSYTKFDCAALHKGQPAGSNCAAQDVLHAAGTCVRDTDFNEWNCEMKGKGGAVRVGLAPPAAPH